MHRQLSELAVVGVSDELIAALTTVVDTRGIRLSSLSEGRVLLTDCGRFGAVLVDPNRLTDPRRILSELTERCVPVFLVTADGSAPAGLQPQTFARRILSYDEIRDTPASVLQTIAGFS